MTYTYYDEFQSLIEAVAEDGSVKIIPVFPGNRDYDDLVLSGATIEPYVAPDPIEPSKDEIRRAYQEESDPLFFEWQAGEGLKSTWEAKRAEIAARYTWVS